MQSVSRLAVMSFVSCCRCASPLQDQHPSHDVRDGERLVKRVYETLRASPDWNNTVLVITWDEHDELTTQQV